MGVIEFIGLITHGGQALDHFGLTNTDCPHWTVRIGLSALGSPHWAVQLELVSPYWSYQFTAYYSAKSL